MTNILLPWAITNVDGLNDCEAGSRRELEDATGVEGGGGGASGHIADCNAVVLMHQPGVGESVTLIVWVGGRENKSMPRDVE